MTKDRTVRTEKRPKKTSRFLTTFSRLKRNKMAMAGMIIILLMIVIAILSPWISPYRYDRTDLTQMFAFPSLAHPFGTDELGRDILSRIMYGGRYSLRIGLISISCAAVAGAAIGSVAGYFGGKSDLIIMRVLDVIQAIPGLVLAIAVSATLGPGFTNCIIALAIGITPAFARMTRASILNIRKMEYLEAATTINASSFRIISRHVLPNALSPLIVQATMSIASAILIAASLSFIGLGVQPPDPEWGAMLAGSRNYLTTYPHLVIFPGITIMLAVLSLNMLGDGLRDALDPKLKD